MKENTDLAPILDRFFGYLSIAFRAKTQELQFAKMKVVLNSVLVSLPPGFVDYFKELIFTTLRPGDSRRGTLLLSDLIYCMEQKAEPTLYADGMKGSYLRAIAPLVREYNAVKNFETMKKVVSRLNAFRFVFIHFAISVVRFFNLKVISKSLQAHYRRLVAPRNEFLTNFNQNLRKEDFSLEFDLKIILLRNSVFSQPEKSAILKVGERMSVFNSSLPAMQ